MIRTKEEGELRKTDNKGNFVKQTIFVTKEEGELRKTNNNLY